MHITTAPSRRRFLRNTLGSAAALGVGSLVPKCLATAADVARHNSERILVVIELAGGNDGLNTVIPYRNEDYYAARPKLGIAKSELIKHSDDLGLHPSLSGVHGLMEDGLAAVIQGVGYENPNRSHFESMDIWHTCRRKEEPRPDGWLGRYLDADAKNAGDQGTGGDVAALHLGHETQPLAVVSREIRVPTIRELSEFELQGKNREALRELLTQRTAPASNGNELLDFLRSSTTSAVEASQRVIEASSGKARAKDYPDNGLGKKLSAVAQLIDAGLSTRVYYMQLDGFDTHAEQAQTHTILLREWSQSVTAFVRDLEQQGNADRVCVMTFSEFGRRVAENASEGTDHGAAGPMFLCGGCPSQSVFGKQPDLKDLLEGDLRHSIDFREVYASLLRNWLSVDDEPILGKKYTALELFNG